MTSWNDVPNRKHSRQEWALVAILAIVLIALAIFIGALPDQVQAQGFPTMSSTSWSATDEPVPAAPTLNPFTPTPTLIPSMPTPTPTPVFTVTLLPRPTQTSAVTPVPEKGCGEKVGGMCFVWLPMIGGG